MGHALAHDVVRRHEGPVAADADGQGAGDPLHRRPERHHQVGREVGQRGDVHARHHEHVPFEQRRPIEEGDDLGRVEHEVRAESAGGDVAEHAVRRGHLVSLLHNGPMDSPRLPPVADPQPAVVELYERAGLRAPDGTPLNIFATFAHHPDLLRRWLVFAAHVLAKNTLPPRDRELLILRTGVRCASQYEFSQHAQIALRCDISADEVQRTKLPVEQGGWAPHDAALLRAADELHDHSCITDATWTALAARYSSEQLLDVVFTVGNYHIVAMALNTCGVQLDAGVPAAL